MRFVAPETVRIDLADGDWIEVKKELGVGEDRRYRTAGVKRANAKEEVEIDWTAMALARVQTYLVDWSARDAKDKPVPVTRQAIEALAVEDFEAIDAAIQAHIAATSEEKKRQSGTKSLSEA